MQAGGAFFDLGEEFGEESHIPVDYEAFEEASSDEFESGVVIVDSRFRGWGVGRRGWVGEHY